MDTRKNITSEIGNCHYMFNKITSLLIIQFVDVMPKVGENIEKKKEISS